MDKMREEFESWLMKSDLAAWVKDISVDENSGDYFSGIVTLMFTAWEAARAMPAGDSCGACGDGCDGYVSSTSSTNNPEHEAQDIRCECCGYMTYQREHMNCIRSAPPAQVPDVWQLVEQLADALRNVEEEMRLLSWQKSIELRRPANSFGIAVKNDQLALEWQEIDAKLQALYAKRLAALAAAQQPAQQLEEVLDGWMLVPVEPTFEMLKAIDQHGEYYSEESLKDAYMDMLSAAPQPKGDEHD